MVALIVLVFILATAVGMPAVEKWAKYHDEHPELRCWFNRMRGV